MYQQERNTTFFIMTLSLLVGISSCGKNKKGEEQIKTTDQVTMQGVHSCNFPNQGFCFEYFVTSLSNEQIQSLRKSCTNPSNSEGIKGNFNTNLSCPTTQRIDGVCRIHTWMNAYFYTPKGTEADAKKTCEQIEVELQRQIGTSVTVTWETIFLSNNRRSIQFKKQLNIIPHTQITTTVMEEIMQQFERQGDEMIKE